MVTLRTRRIGAQTYYYLAHSIRSGKGWISKEKYLGKRPPGDLEVAKREFLREVDRGRWQERLADIKRGYRASERALSPPDARKRDEAFSTRFTYDTNRIEGSRLTFRENADLLERGITPREKPLEDVLEAKAHAELFSEVLAEKRDLSLGVLLRWHKRLFGSTKPAIAGRVRRHDVEITGSRFVPPIWVELERLLREFFKWYSGARKKVDGVELAGLVHLRFVTIHPFGDGNGRISRLAMNFVLHRHGYPMLNIRYERRRGYYRALERAQVTGKEQIFLAWLMRRYLKENERYERGARAGRRGSRRGD